MAGRTVTVELPDELYDRLSLQAGQAQRSVAAEVVHVLATAVPAAEDGIPLDLRIEIERLEALDDAALWKLARAKFPAKTAKRMQALIFKQQSEGLTADEDREQEALADEYDRRMLIRANVLLLLTQRGHNIDELFAPR